MSRPLAVRLLGHSTTAAPLKSHERARWERATRIQCSMARSGVLHARWATTASSPTRSTARAEQVCGPPDCDLWRDCFRVLDGTHQYDAEPAGESMTSPERAGKSARRGNLDQSPNSPATASRTLGHHPPEQDRVAAQLFQLVQLAMPRREAASRDTPGARPFTTVANTGLSILPDRHSTNDLRQERP